MNNRVFLIFDKTTFKEGIERYLSIGKDLDIIPVYENAINDEAIIGLNRLYLMEHVYRNDVINIIDKLQKSIGREKRIKKLYALLGQMMCYWFIREYSAVRKIQQSVKPIKYDASWWEKNKKGAASIAGALLSGAMSIAGGGAAVSQMTVKGGQIMGETIEDHQKLESDFNRLKDAILSINFDIKS